ncbi:hypothetical protein [Phenylobacterium aquaticum]|uniref:hypothetical protein n=1 Tax=Phenylobacterium aquaticum TaxID=1763816 RepID=UPI0026E981F7|nr:hypothetical protein [Phenylobacterium aquaticum]
MGARGKVWIGGVLAIGLAGAALAGCSQANLPKDALDSAVNDAVGDPNTCVLIGAQDKSVLYRFGSHVACAAKWPDCNGGQRSAEDLLKLGAPVAASCPSSADGARGVGWAAGPVEGKPFAYAAAMEGENSPPGLIIADKLKAAFKRAGL